ncbi:NADPH:quinone reductase [Streptomyces roseifaciens]
MRAAYIDRLGPPEEIVVGELPAPRPGPGPTDVLVDVAATTVNPVDALVRSGRFRTALPFPFVIGRDLVGTVTEAGPGAPGFAPGDPVWCNSLGHCGRQGAAAERAVVPADRLYPLPAGARPEDVVAVAHPAVTAYLALFTHGALRAGGTVFVGGAAGNVGSALVVLAVWAGARVVATTAARDAEYVRSLGADEVLDYAGPGLAGRLAAAAPRGVDVHVATHGGHDLDAAVPLLAPRGRIVLLAGVAARPVLPVGPLYQKGGAVVGFAISHASTAELAEAAGVVGRLAATGRLRARAVERLPLAAAAEAHRRMEDGGLRGRRLLLTI